jgi:PKD repeat protein
MKRNKFSNSGALNPRILAAFLMCAAAAWLTAVSFATPSPATATLSTSNKSITYTDSTGAPPNLTAVALGKPNCGPSDAACSVFTLNIGPSVKTPATGYDPAAYQILLQWSWAVATVDYDIFVEDSAGNLVAKNNSTADPSSIVIPANQALNSYKLVVVLSTGAPIAYTGTITLQPAPPTSGLCNPAVSNCAPPRYQNFPAGPGQADGAGEPSIGIDWNPNVATLKHDKVNTGGVAFFTANRTDWRVNFDDCSSPAINLWEDASAITTQEFVLTDPIGFVDHYSAGQLGISYPPPHTPGRVFSLDLIGGEGDSFGSYSDTDGNAYLPGGNGGPGQGPDHETLGGGPYAAPVPSTKTNSYPNAIYYCSQNIVAEAQCSRSDDGGQTFGPAIPIFSPGQCTGGIHGHVKVARDGTVYVPNSSCGTTGTAGVAVSTDNGLTWTENNVTNSTSNQDPSVGIGQNNVGKPPAQATNTMYLGYVDGDGHAKIAKSGNKGVNYSVPVDVGAAFGVTHAVFPVVVTGDDDRASFAFLGTGDGVSTNTTPCNVYGAVLNCKNIWHLYIATTYDGGANWITIDATPDDPAQQGTVCLEGTTCMGGRNLLDFNDFAIDSQGRGLVGWADGCVNCSNTFNGQSSAAHGTVTRQSGGRRLFAFFDPVEPAAPAAPQLVSAVSQATGGTLITWLQPDNGGSPITGYNIYRGASSGTETFLAHVAADTNKYLDPAPPAGNAFYYVTAVNVVHESDHCREVSSSKVVSSGNSCTAPYLEVQGAAASASADPTGQYSIQHVNVGEPFTSCSAKTLTTVLKVNTMDPAGTGQAAPPPDSTWRVQFDIPGSANSTGHAQTIFMAYDTTVNPAGATDYGWIDPATGSACNQCLAGVTSCPNTATVAPDGTITMRLDVSSPLTFGTCASTGGSDMTINPAQWTPGTQLTKIKGISFQRIGGAINGVTVAKAQTPGDGVYTLKGNIACQGLVPLAALTASPQSGEPPLTVQFDGSGSKEPAGACGTINSYTMNFGDGSPAVTQATAKFSHTYAAEGEYPAQLAVKDTNGQTNTNVAQVVISVAGNTPPTADLRASPTSGDKPLMVKFDATHSTDPDFSDTIASYTFRFGDGTADVTQGSPTISHAYAVAGTFAARLVVTDSRGAKSENTAQVDITVTQPAPSVTPTPSPGGTATPTPTPGGTATPTPTPGGTATPTPTPGGTATPTPTPGGTVTPTPTPGGTATPTPTPGGTATPSPTATPTATPTPQPTPTNVELLNISGRVFTQGADNVGIGGFIINGEGTVRVMGRGLGPSLKVNGTPVQGRLENPVLELHDSNGHVLSNDDWRSTQEAEVQGSGLAPTDDREAAIIKRLPAGNYTAIIRGANSSSGIGLAELYDLDSSDPGELGNLSVRALVQTDDDVLIDGVILRGGNSKRVVFRAIGPELHDRGVQGELQDPTLDVYDQNGTLLRTNDNWKDAPNSAEIQSAGLAPTDERESAILLTLPSGNYTSIVRGAGRTTGIALSEAFKLD